MSATEAREASLPTWLAFSIKKANSIWSFFDSYPYVIDISLLPANSQRITHLLFINA